MSKEKKTQGFLYTVQMNSDTTEGRGQMVIKGVTPNKEEAQKVADKFEPYGHSGQFNRVGVIPYFETAEEFPDYPSEKNLRKKALAKLTPLEKKALGFGLEDE